MKIAISDNQSLKFDMDLKKYWEKHHDVRYEIGASPQLAQWADVYYINCWDNNIHALHRWYKDKSYTSKTKVICRVLDWEAWIGHARDEEMANWVDEIIAIAPHIQRKLEAENPAMVGKVKLIRPGIDLNRFTFKKKFGGYNIVLPCNEIDYWAKGVLSGIKIFKELTIAEPSYDWKLFVKGRWCKGPFEQTIIKDYIEKAELTDRVQFDDKHVDDYNAYLENMDYCIQPSLKEAFSFVVAECAAKGIKPVLNYWHGADEIWPREWLYLTEGQAIGKILEPWKGQKYRDYIVKNHNVERVFKEYDALL
jgi:glycosyltransferase involved in cell wall biosynthesis